VPDKFPAKLLLFGEYTVLDGSQALSVPLPHLTGKWNKQEESGQMSLIPEYYRWLQKVDLADEQTYEKMVAEFEDGWTYESNIPVGYGVGSSGAYVAAMYDRYINNGEKDINKATEKMAQMEAYFHGSSSGMDPLVSYTGKAVYKNEKGDFQLLDNIGWPEGFKVYLLDSGIPRETASLVNRYKERTEDKTVTEKIKQHLVPMVENAIHCYLEGENQKLEECVGVISQFQRENFKEVIPDAVQKLWDEISSRPGVYMKLCGAGGGGYYLVIDSKGRLDAKGLVPIQA